LAVGPARATLSARPGGGCRRPGRHVAQARQCRPTVRIATRPAAAACG
jgi:hypothetical protein